MVRVGVSENGDVESTEVINGNPVLAQAAVDAAKNGNSNPILRTVHPRKAAVNLLFAFVLLDTDSRPDVTAESLAQDTPRGLITVRLTGGGSGKMVVHRVEPDYPYIAKAARVQGTVVMFAVIGKDGGIHDLRLVSGHPLLAKAALGAVMQWRYKPFLLDGQPIDVQTTIETHFSLPGS